MIGAQAQGLDGARRGVHAVGGDLGAVVQGDGRHALPADLQAPDAALHAPFDAMLTATVDEQTNDLADTDERTRKALLEQGTPHDRELRDLDVVLDRATVKTSREQ